MTVLTAPKEIFDEFNTGRDFKNAIGDRGIYEQTKMNERFFVGDQWHGVQAGNTRPLVRRNVIKRIGEYKIAAICSTPVKVNFSAEGVETTGDAQEEKSSLFTEAAPTGKLTDKEINGVMAGLTDYIETVKERVRFSEKATAAVKDAYISGTSYIYTYWDETVNTGLYYGGDRRNKIKGDVSCSVLNVVNVVLGDGNDPDIQRQPYIIISQRLPLSEVERESEIWGKDGEITEDTGENPGDRGEREQDGAKRVTVLTKLWKEYDKDGVPTVWATRVTEKAVLRKPWSLGIKLYPLASFMWLDRFSSGYGDSEITYLIPNQIAINRALSAAVWATMTAGMPKMVVNRDLVSGTVSNDPGQIINIAAGNDYDVARAVQYVHPPQFTPQFQNIIGDIAQATLSDSGANDAALGDIRPDNASAVIAIREAALMPMQIYQNRFYAFVEDIARIWADFWVNMYGERRLRLMDGKDVRYMAFDGERYKELIINARVDVGASTLWGEAVVVSTLGNLLNAGVITPRQYLERLPKGTVPDITGLLRDIDGKEDALSEFKEKYPEEFRELEGFSEEERKALLKEAGIA